MNDWRPIATAPKDGTRILGYGLWAGEINGVDPSNAIAIIRWTGGRTDYTGFEWDVCGTDAYGAWMDAAYWMPLPPEPFTDA